MMGIEYQVEAGIRIVTEIKAKVQIAPGVCLNF